jgi:putative cardiolipin synthase
VYARAVGSRFLDDLVEERIAPLVAPVTVVTAHPEKLENPVGDEQKALASELVRHIREARAEVRAEVIVVTPYFVQRERGVAFLSELRAKGVRVAVVTSSLASTNHVAVHSGCFHHREALLEVGVELHEVKVDALAPAGNPGRLTLHTKAVIVDRSVLFVGSLNIDLRSIDINTEMGLFVHSTEAATRFAAQLDADLAPYTYRVALNDDGAVQWRYEGGAQEVVHEVEPDTGFWRRFSLGL